VGPKLWQKKRGDTLFSLRAIPVGGYCKMQGFEDESVNSKDFNSKTVWQRAKIMFAGPFMNFFVSLVLVFILTAIDGFVVPKARYVNPDYPAAAAGMQDGDRIIKINGRRINIYEDLSMAISELGNAPAEIIVEREGKHISLIITPAVSETGGVVLGFTPDFKTGLFAERIEGYDRENIFECLSVSFDSMLFYIRSTAEGIMGIFTREVSTDELAGPIGVVQVISDSYEMGLSYSVGTAVKNMLYIAALLSANLGAVNLLPLPALDGGKLVLLLIEGIRGKAMNPNTEGIINFAGFALLFCLMIFLAFNDISRIV
ncbi:MAG: RIP metalloprotease RseP, partial [Firmicutes bacterium]|nr:RIP metalloprotease RseP [Bacillota bacterium]